MKFNDIALLLALAHLASATPIVGVGEALKIAKDAGKIPSMWFYPTSDCSGDEYGPGIKFSGKACYNVDPDTKYSNGTWIAKDGRSTPGQGCVYAYRDRDCPDEGDVYYPIDIGPSGDTETKIAIQPSQVWKDKATAEDANAEKLKDWQPQSFWITENHCQ